MQEKAGELLGNPGQEIKGIGKQVAGKAQKALGNMKETAADAVKGGKR